ncbi:LuxR family transcriptional regulator [Gracilibacillus halophilus YIM-C55.5]|uniref:LuxR family transcriptional regulator n=1 Tax=Gracilibacillus halophilus YIM-C55.5 TaxID=1308866 RepID=N4WUU3_9BACI|nr:response regulator transcription factor [Gracilibacillus halophilus]ENH98095.1 LuxR family transcriptional regulator [Gracilibacillus halophilus YIM-C55.5]
MRIAVMKEPSVYREGLVGVLRSAFPRYETVVMNPQEEEKLSKYIVDLLVVDIDSHHDTIPLIQHYADQGKKIIVWTENLQHPGLVDLFRLQLQGYFFNGMEKDELVHAIQKILIGQPYVHEELSSVLLGTYREINNLKETRPVGVFTNREWEIMGLLTKGYNNEKIGTKLYITEKTVKNHVSSILKKLGVPDRTNAVLTALRNRWFTIS